MTTRPHPDAIINAFLSDATAVQEKIIERCMPDPNDDPETRIVKRFTRDMQLIVVNSATELAALPGGDSIGRGVVILARNMLQGVAAIIAPFTDEPEAVEHFSDYFKRAMERSHDDNDE